MQEINIDIAPLIVQYLDGTLSDDERARLMHWADQSAAHQALFAQLQQPGALRQFLKEYDAIDAGAAYTRWKSNLDQQLQDATQPPEENHPASYIPPVHRVHFLRRWGWAAASVIVLAAGASFWILHQRNTKPARTAVATADIAPGRNGAILTLADGTQVVLDSLGNGVIAQQNGAEVRLQNGQLAYDARGEAVGAILYNTMSTPKGRQFQITLPDGTRVWLNAASSIRYPTVFTGRERRVEIAGEAYFEIAKNEKMTFHVNVNNRMDVEVLGTHFNVNAYDNETGINTTLLEGSLRITSGRAADLAVKDRGLQGNAVVLKPGQQAQVPASRQMTSGIKVVNNADIDKVMAWKNGLFYFDGASLAEIMRQLERWYDIEVVYEKGVPAIDFEGKMTKDIPLNGLLIALERSDVHFRIEGRRLIVLP